MRFGLFGSAQANSGDLPPESGQGFRDYLDLQRRGRGARLPLDVPGRASFHRLEPGFRDADAAHLRGDAHDHVARRFRRHRAAVAQSGSAGRAGRDARSRLRRPARFRHRQGLPAQRVHRLSDSAGGSRRALRGGARSHHPLVALAPAVLPSRPVLALRRHRGRAAAGAAAASAVLGRGRERRVDPARGRARLQSDSRPVCLAGSDRRADRALPPRARSAWARLRSACRWRWRGSSTSPTAAPMPRPCWPGRRSTPSAPSMCRARPAAAAARTCWPMRTRPAAPKRMRSTARPMKSAAQLAALQRAGAEYVLLTMPGGKEQLRRFAREIMPAFSASPKPADVSAGEPSSGVTGSRMTDTLKPRDAKEVESAVQWALAEGKALEVAGQGSKRAIGRPAQTDLTLDLSGLSGVTLYEPEELVLSARAGTPLAEIEALVAANGQQLAFEPMDCGPILGGARRPRHHRRRARHQSRRSAPHPGRRRARSLPRRDGGVGPRRDLQVRRPGGQERHRLRPLQAARRLLGDARGDDRRHDQDAAAAGERGDDPGARPRARATPSRR